MSNKLKHDGEVRDTYLELVKKFPLVSIRSSRQLRAAQKMIDSLLAREPLDEGEDVYLDALSDLVAIYEDEEFELEQPTDAALLQHLIEAKGQSQTDVAIGIDIPKSTISEILNGKRELTRQQIMKVADYFNVEPAAFMRKQRQ